jgi:hypothetical protein
VEHFHQSLWNISTSLCGTFSPVSVELVNLSLENKFPPGYVENWSTSLRGIV